MSPTVVEDENGDIIVDSHVSNRQKNYFCQLLDVHGVNKVTQIEMHTVEPLVPEPSCFDIKIAIEKLKK
jgi:hypothetical protein